MDKYDVIDLFAYISIALLAGCYVYWRFDLQNFGFKQICLMTTTNNDYFPVYRHARRKITIISDSKRALINHGQYQGKRKLRANTLYVEGLSRSVFEELNCFIEKHPKIDGFNTSEQLIVEHSELSPCNFDKFLSSTSLNEVRVEIYYCNIDEDFVTFLKYLNSKDREWIIEKTNFRDCTVLKRMTKSDYDTSISSTFQSIPGDQTIQNTVAPKAVVDSGSKDTDDNSVSHEKLIEFD